MSDTIVIGGGVMGLAAARDLRRRGHNVTLLERAVPGRAASWASAGIIGATIRSESDPSFLLRRVSRALWPAFAASIHEESGLDPEYQHDMGCLHLASDETELAVLQNAAQRADGGAEVLDTQGLRTLEPSLSPTLLGGLLVPGGNVDNRRLVKALEIAVRHSGVNIENGAEVRALTTVARRNTYARDLADQPSGESETPEPRRVTGVETAERTYRADVVVIAAGAWSSSIANLEPRPPVRPQRGQILALDQTAIGLHHVLLTAEDPYFVPRKDGRLVVGATREDAGWDASLTAGGVAWLLSRATDIVPALAACPIAELWTGFRPLSADSLPLIGQGSVDGLYFLTGHGPSGIAPLPGSVALLMALIHGERPPLPPDPFDPLRFLKLKVRVSR